MVRSLVLLLLLSRSAASQTRAIVYTTAESTSFRLTPTDTLMFKPTEPTSEGKVYVFADPRRTFQPFIGIGGALTDAAAETFAKFVASYKKEGVPVWGITIQNEPMATQKWESCVYQASDERDFLKHHLGPVMAQQGLLGNVNIIVWDHNRDLIIQRALAIFDDSAATKYAWGIGFHWYDDWSGGQQMYGNVALVSRLYPDKHILFTEGTPASFDSTAYERWSLGEAYGRAMTHDFNSGAEGWP